MRRTYGFALSVIVGTWIGLVFWAVLGPEALAASKKGLPALHTPLPLHFVENRGQVEDSVRFHDRDRTIFFERHSIRLQRPGQAAPVVLTAVGMSPAVELIATEPLPGQVSYFSGSSPGGHSGLESYGAVVYRNAYPGVDLKFYGTAGHLEYDVIVHPGADLSPVRFQIVGARHLERSTTGDLLAHLPHGQTLVQRKPFTYQWVGGRKVEIPSGFRLDEDGVSLSPRLSDVELSREADRPLTYGFAIAPYDPAQPLVIDPVLAFSTYLGNLGAWWGSDIAIDRKGSIYVAGQTHWGDAFVIKLHPTGKQLDLVYVAYIGGSKNEWSNGIALDQAGNAYITGATSSEDFPVEKALYPKLAGRYDMFVSKLGPSGTELVYSTYLGGTDNDYAVDMALDETGKIYVTGETQSADFPLESAYDDMLDGGYDAVVVKLSATGQALLYSTYVGGNKYDAGAGISTDQAGNAYVIGDTYSSDFPTRHAYDSTLGGDNDAFVTKLSPSGNTLVYSTFLGGNGYDFGEDLDVDRSGNVYVTGTTQSSNFPTKRAFDSSPGKNYDAFVTKLASTGQALIYSTYLGGSNYDRGWGIEVNDQGEAYLVGETKSVDFPTKRALYKERSGKTDAFVIKLNASGSLRHSTYLGGGDHDYGYSIAVHNAQHVYVTGETGSGDFPTKQAFTKEPWFAGYYDAFLAVIEPDQSSSRPERPEEEPY